MPSISWNVFSRRKIGSDRLSPMPVKLAGEKIGITDCCGLLLAFGTPSSLPRVPPTDGALRDVVQHETREAYAKIVHQVGREDVHVIGDRVLVGRKGSAGEGVFVPQRNRAGNAGDLHRGERIGYGGRRPLECPAGEETIGAGDLMIHAHVALVPALRLQQICDVVVGDARNSSAGDRR